MVVERLAEQVKKGGAIAKILLLTGLGQPFCRSPLAVCLFHTGHIGVVGCRSIGFCCRVSGPLPCPCLPFRCDDEFARKECKN